jgi:N-acetylmuramoyl-L-alanine amidase
MKALGLLLAVMILFADDLTDAEHPRITASSTAFQESLTSSIEQLKKARFPDGLETPSLGATSNEDFQKAVVNIRAETPIPEVSEGKRGFKYDVILQPGHYGRTTGAVGTAGRLVSERALAAYVTNIAAQRLRSSGNSVLVVSADKYLRPTSKDGAFDGLRAKVFLAIHADGSVQPCSTGLSLAYQSQSSLLAMHAVGWALAAALGYSYSDFRKDNFTVNEAQYYMFRQVRADRLTGLLEIGELTCPATEKQLISFSDLIALNIARGVNFIVQTPSE